MYYFIVWEVGGLKWVSLDKTKESSGLSSIMEALGESHFLFPRPSPPFPEVYVPWLMPSPLSSKPAVAG